MALARTVHDIVVLDPKTGNPIALRVPGKTREEALLAAMAQGWGIHQDEMQNLPQQYHPHGIVVNNTMHASSPDAIFEVETVGNLCPMPSSA